jgi:hypothetical protein
MVKGSLGSLGDEEAGLAELATTDRLKKLSELLIKRNREQAFKIDTLLDKVSLISQELNKNARARGASRCAPVLYRPLRILMRARPSGHSVPQVWARARGQRLWRAGLRCGRV